MNRLSRNLITIYRTEHLIARRRIAVLRQQTALMAMAGLAALAGLILLNVAAFLVLSVRVSPAAAAALLAVANLALAAGLMVMAGRRRADEDIAPAIELRDMAIADIEDEIEVLTTEARDVAAAIKGIGSNPLGALSSVLVPILAAVLKNKGQ